MYTPQHFALDPQQSLEVIRANSFGTLVSAGPGGIVASHVPFVVGAGGEFGTLRAHVARANQQWSHFDGVTEALAIFQGAHGYISPAWYPPGDAVPTWDYVAVHAYGVPRVVRDEDAVLEMLRELVEANEAAREEPWLIESVDAEYLRRLSRGVVAFEVPITRLEGKAKLGQNRPAVQPGVVEGLAALRQPWATELAELVRRANGLA